MRSQGLTEESIVTGAKGLRRHSRRKMNPEQTEACLGSHQESVSSGGGPQGRRGEPEEVSKERQPYGAAWETGWYGGRTITTADNHLARRIEELLAECATKNGQKEVTI